MTYGIEIGVDGSHFEIASFDSLGRAYAAFKAAEIPASVGRRQGYVHLVELDSTGAPCATIEERWAAAE